MEGKMFVIEGARIAGITSFYAEINRVFMTGEDWMLGSSLDALNDMLYGGYGAISGNEPVTIIWREMENSRHVLGIETTRNFYREKLDQPQRYDVARIEKDLASLENGDGATFFEIVLEIVADHPNIRLVAG